ncbi:hypothetical protein [Sulfurimonas sp.]
MKKELFLSMLVAFALVGCGGDISSGESTLYHNQGSACLSCHNAPAIAAEGRSFYSGATVYTELNATAATQYASGYSLKAVLSNGIVVNFGLGRGTGNFNSIDSRLLSYLFTTELVDANGTVVSSSATNSHGPTQLDCNSCHTAVGINGAPGRIAPPTITAPSNAQALSFATDVMPILTASCKGCHGTNGRYTVTTAAATYTNIGTFNGIDTVTPTNSLLLTKASGVNHGGGTVLGTTTVGYMTIRNWIMQGALNN